MRSWRWSPHDRISALIKETWSFSVFLSIMLGYKKAAICNTGIKFWPAHKSAYSYCYLGLFSLQFCEKCVCWLNHTVHGILLYQSELTKLSSFSFVFLHVQSLFLDKLVNISIPKAFLDLRKLCYKFLPVTTHSWILILKPFTCFIFFSIWTLLLVFQKYQEILFK